MKRRGANTCDARQGGAGMHGVVTQPPLPDSCPYAGIIRIRFKGFASLRISGGYVDMTATPQDQADLIGAAAW